MIHSLDIANFRCFKHLSVDRCHAINVIVGENGVGKTTLLEAIFFALASSPDISVRYRAQRGLGASFNAPPYRIEEAIWRDLFYKRRWDEPISVRLRADGADNRSVTVSRGGGELLIPLSELEKETPRRSASLVFEWKNAAGETRSFRPRFASQGFVYREQEEDLPDFFYFAANQIIPAEESAQRFSEIGFEGRRGEFIQFFTREYPWLDDLSIEVIAGSPTLYATMRGSKDRFPLAVVSNGVNRVLSIMLAIASHPKAVVLIDEIENGIYFRHQDAVWRGLVSLARKHMTQVFMTTHNDEWLEAVFQEDDVEDVALWRLTRKVEQPTLLQFSGKQAAIALQSAGEVR
jgi:energy-coupling factor transporter ATP-binding protein EcfA2